MAVGGRDEIDAERLRQTNERGIHGHLIRKIRRLNLDIEIVFSENPDAPTDETGKMLFVMGDDGLRKLSADACR